MRKLAKCVGCTAPALYRHYESKEGVMREVVAEAYRLFAQYLYRALEGRTPPERFTWGSSPEREPWRIRPVPWGSSGRIGPGR